MTIAVDVGLHQASPPPSYCGYSPACVSCESGGTARSRAIPARALGIRGAGAVGASDTTALTARNRGLGSDASARCSQTRRRYARIGVAAAKKVSTWTRPSASDWPARELRLI